MNDMVNKDSCNTFTVENTVMSRNANLPPALIFFFTLQLLHVAVKGNFLMATYLIIAYDSSLFILIVKFVFGNIVFCKYVIERSVRRFHI